MSLAKNKKTFAALSAMVISLASLFTLAFAGSTAHAQTYNACASAGSARAIEQCQVNINNRIREECTQTNPTANDACVQNLTQGNADNGSGRVNEDPQGFSDEEPAAGNIQLDKDLGEYKDQCGKGSREVKIRFNFNCIGENYPTDLNPIIDLLFALIRTASAGVGIMLVIVIIISGIRFSTAQGDPQAVGKAVAGIRNAVIGLLFYFLAFALLQWLVPGGVFNSVEISGSVMRVIS